MSCFAANLCQNIFPECKCAVFCASSMNRSHMFSRFPSTVLQGYQLDNKMPRPSMSGPLISIPGGAFPHPLLSSCLRSFAPLYQPSLLPAALANCLLTASSCDSGRPKALPLQARPGTTPISKPFLVPSMMYLCAKTFVFLMMLVLWLHFTLFPFSFFRGF